MMYNLLAELAIGSVLLLSAAAWLFLGGFLMKRYRTSKIEKRLQDSRNLAGTDWLNMPDAQIVHIEPLQLSHTQMASLSQEEMRNLISKHSGRDVSESVFEWGGFMGNDQVGFGSESSKSMDNFTFTSSQTDTSTKIG